jgi:hypothetical protein
MKVTFKIDIGGIWSQLLRAGLKNKFRDGI